MLLPKFDILNKIKKERTITLGGVSKLPYSKKNHKALTFTSQGFAMSKSCCTFGP